MRPLRNCIIVQAYLNQKSEMKFGSLTLHMPPKWQNMSLDGKVVNPTIAQVTEENAKFDFLKKGDILCLGHNSIDNESWRISLIDGIVTMALPVDRWILGKLDQDGILQPLMGNIVASRINQYYSSIIIIPDSAQKTDENKMVVVSVSPEEKLIKPKDTILVHKFADYEIFYNFNNEQKSAVVIDRQDIVAII